MKALVVTVLLVFLFLFHPVASAQGPNEIQQPSYKEGERWKISIRWQRSGAATSRSNLMSDGTYEIVIGPKGPEIYLLGEGGSRERFVVAEGFGFPMTLVFLLYNDRPEIEWFKWPLKAGMKWNFRYFLTTTGGRGNYVDASVEVTGVEDIKTPAGEFRSSLKLVRTERSGRADRSLTYRVHENAKSVVKSETILGANVAFAMELLEYQKSR